MAKKSTQRDDEPEDQDFEIVDDDPKPRRKKRVEIDRDRRPRREERNDEDEEQPRPKKKKKKKRLVASQDKTGRFEAGIWMACGPMIVCGLAFCFIAAGGMAPKGEGFKAIAIMLVAVAITIPLSVGALMVGGMFMNIEYGEWKAAIIKLTAISILNNGLLWLGQWIGLPFYIALLICGIVGFSLFMTLFQLDAWETQMSIVAINLVQFGARFIIMGLLAAGARHNEKKMEREQFDAPMVQPKDDGKMPDDDGDEP